MQVFYAGIEIALTEFKKVEIKGALRSKGAMEKIDYKVVIECTRKFYGFDVRTKSRKKPRPDAKKVFSHILYSNGYILKEIAVIVEVDHTTICHHLDRFADYYYCRDPLIADYIQICEKLGIEPAEPNRLMKKPGKRPVSTF